MVKLFRKLAIKWQMLIFVLVPSVALFAAIIMYISLTARDAAHAGALDRARGIGQSAALTVEQELDASMDVLRTLSQSFVVHGSMPPAAWKAQLGEIYTSVMRGNPQFYKLWDSWELKAFDPAYDKPHGRYTNSIRRRGAEIERDTALRSLDGDPPLYAKIKRGNREEIWEPYFDQYAGGQQERRLMTSLSVPLRRGAEYIGIVACDIVMDRFHDIVSPIRPFPSSYAVLLSNEGAYVSHPDTTLVGGSIALAHPALERAHNVEQRIRAGEAFEADDVAPDGGKTLLFFSPVVVGRTQTPWSVCIAVPEKVVLAAANRGFALGLLMALAGLALLSALVFRIANGISQAFRGTTGILEKLSRGDIDGVERADDSRGDEIGQMSRSLNTLVLGLGSTARFAGEIGQRRLDSDFEPLSPDDTLGNALLRMRDNLRDADRDERLRQAENEKQRWATEGIAKFGEILRNDNDDIKRLSYNILSNLVSYTGVAQGALFVADDGDDGHRYLELMCAIAHNRQKWMRKRMKVGEDLVGRCAYERATIHLTRLPEGYAEISTGMGQAAPRSLTLVPILMNDTAYGVLELASFHELQPHQIEFVEKIGESIASTLANVKNNEKTLQLLERSQAQHEELHAKEEEMRQNLEELQATQEESARIQSEMRGMFNALDTSSCTIEYDLQGNIISVNDAMLELTGLTRGQVVGTSHRDGSNLFSRSPQEYCRFWDDLRAGIQKKEINHLTANGRDIFLSETYTPILDNDGNPHKILKISFDVTDRIRVEKESEQRRQRIDELERRLADLERNATPAAEEPAPAAPATTPQTVEPEPSVTSTASHEPSPAPQPAKIHKAKPAANEELDIKPEAKPQPQPAAEPESAPAPTLADLPATGDADIDAQRRRLADLALQLADAQAADRPKKELKEMLKNVADFAAYHFGSEQRLLRQAGYPGAAGRAKEQARLIDAIEQFRRQFNAAGAEAFVAALTSALANLLADGDHLPLLAGDKA